MLSNFGTGSTAPLQSFLVGQPQFRAIMASSDLEQLRQRVIASYHLGPMSEDETKAYVLHRLRTVGWRDDPTLSDDAFAAIYANTDGVPRRINTLCSRVLLWGYLEERHAITGPDVTQVADELLAEFSASNGTLAPMGSAARVNGADPLLADLLGRVGALEQSIAKQERTVKRALEIIVNYMRQSA